VLFLWRIILYSHQGFTKSEWRSWNVRTQQDRQFTCNVILRRVYETIVVVKKKKDDYTFACVCVGACMCSRMCMCAQARVCACARVALLIQHARHCHIFICSVYVSTTFFDIISQTVRFS
jgi:hypothetical protein